jgi:N-formylglutamate deformylase
MNAICRLTQGNTPLLISMPHTGTDIPPDQQARYQPRALQSEDTDWHLQRMYRPLAEAIGASLLVPHFSRYVIDLNRPPDDTPMYPGAANTELCPTHFFSGEALYLPGQEPDAREKLRRRTLYWQPYHDTLAAELQRLKSVHGHVVLFDAHSIRSELPWLFQGRLPDLNLGTADEHSCDPRITTALTKLMAAQDVYSHVVNGRFKGGYITRHYGRPETQCHAVQLEMCQCNYMNEQAPFEYDEVKARSLQPLLRAMLETLVNWTPQP